MSISPEDEKKLFDDKELARKVHSAVNQGFAAAGITDDPYGNAFSDAQLEQVNRVVAGVIDTLHSKVKDMRRRGYTQVVLHTYCVSDSGNYADLLINRAAHERLLAAINTNSNLHAWVEGDAEAWLGGRNCRLMLDFSRVYATLLTSHVRLDSPR